MNPDEPGYQEAVQAILKPTEDIRQEQSHQKTLIRAVALIALVALVAAGIAIYAIFQINDAKAAQNKADKLEIARQALSDYEARVSQCNTGNSFRSQDSTLWTTIFSFPQATNSNQTAQQKKIEAQNLATFKAFLKVHDAPTDCTKIPFPVAAIPALNLKSTSTSVPANVTTTLGSVVITNPSVTASAGKQGAQGGQGSQGSQGSQGPQGVPGMQGTQGATGSPGVSPFPIHFRFQFSLETIGHVQLGTFTFTCDILNSTTTFVCPSS